MSYTQPELVNQILAQAPNTDVALAMLMGSDLESGQNPNLAVPDTGGTYSYGPFMFNTGGELLAVGGQTQAGIAAAQDPTTAVAAILPAYAAGAAGGSGHGYTGPSSALWGSNPELAAEETATVAEGPGQSYISGQGQAKVDSAYALALQELGGATPSAYTTSTKVTTGGQGKKADPNAIGVDSGPVPNIFAGIPGVSGIDAIGKFFSGLSSAEIWIRIGEVLLGVVIFGGSIVLFVAVLAAENKALSAAGAVVGLGSMMGLGRKADSGFSAASASSKMSAPSSSSSSYDKWWKEGNRRPRREFGSGDTRESEDLSRWAREQSLQSREISRRRTSHRADEDEF